MKPIISFALLGALFAVGAANAAVTDPVGYVSLGDTTVGQPAVKANTDAFISIPLNRPSVYAGGSASVAGDVVTFSGTPGFTVNQFIATPHVIFVETGVLAGLTALITANTASSVTVSTQAGDSIATLGVGTTVSIRPAWTLKTLFAGNTIPVGTLLSVYGTAAGVNVPADTIFEFDGIDWADTDTFAIANDVVLYPGEGFKLRSPGSPIASLVVTGEVNTAKYRNVIQKYLPSVGQDNWISYFSPVDEIIGVSGLGFTAGDLLIDRSNSTAGINKPAAQILEFDGVGWADTDTFADVTLTFQLKGGKAYQYRRAASAPVGPVIVSDVPTFVPSL